MLKLLVLISLFGGIFSSKTSCPRKQVWDDCGSACPPTCDNLGMIELPCPAVCVSGCRCKDGLITVKNQNGDITDCIRRNMCPPPSCDAPLEWNSCGSACTVTCDQPNIPCNKPCEPRCQCPQKTPLQDIDYVGELRCVSKSQCCPKGKVFNLCASACPPECYPDVERVCVPLCLSECTCPRDKPIEITDDNGNFKCISRDQCPPKCKAPLEWNSCGSACTVTCDQPNIPCNKPCEPRCQCPQKTPLQDIDYVGELRCVSKSQCCPKGKVFNLCASACPPECYPDVERVCVPLCLSECTCPRDKPIEITDDNGNFKCISRDQCPPKCKGGQVWMKCGSACTRTCVKPNPTCTKKCEARCQCPKNKPIWHNNRCVKKRACRKGGKKPGKR